MVFRLHFTFSGGTSQALYTLPSATSSYTITQSTGASIVPGDNDIGNHTDDTPTTIPLPFDYNFYGQTFTSANLCPNGNIQFLSADYGYGCVPFSLFNYALLPFCTDLVTDSPAGGIFTSITGSAPNRIFNIEWRAAFFTGGTTVNVEVRLYEARRGSTSFMAKSTVTAAGLESASSATPAALTPASML